MSISHRARRRGALHALCAVMAAAALCAFSWQAAFAAPAAPDTTAAPQATAHYDFTWKIVDSTTGNPLSDSKISIKNDKDVEVFAGSNDNAVSSLEPGVYKIEASRYNYSSMNATFTVLPDGSSVGLDSNNTTIRLKARQYSHAMSVRWEGSEPPSGIGMTVWSPNGKDVQENAVLTAENGWKHSYSLPEYQDGKSLTFNQGIFDPHTGEFIEGAFVLEGKVWYLDTVEYPPNGDRTYVLKYARDFVASSDPGYVGTEGDIPGATVQILTGDGKTVIDEWVTGPEHLVWLTKGDYIFREVKAPLGWEKAEDIHFSVSLYHVITQEGVINIGQHVIMNEKKTIHPALISKLSSEGGALAGAHMQILENGDVIRDWTSGDAAFQADLPFGSYVLREAEAPEGYEPVGDVAFRVEPDGTFVVESGEATVDAKTNTLAIVDQKLPEPEPEQDTTPEPGKDPNHDGNKKPAAGKPASAKQAKALPATSNGAAPLAAGAVVAAALAGVLALGVAARRKNAA